MRGCAPVVALSCVVAMATVAEAGTVIIGIDPLNGGTKAGTCHATTFKGPSDIEAAYRTMQLERFEPVDELMAERLRQHVSVRVEVITYKQNRCGQNSGTPQKIVLTPKGAREPLLTISLEPESVPMSNMLGAESIAMEGSATLRRETIAALAGRDLDFYLVYKTHTFKDRWKSHYAAEILKAKK